MTFYVCKHCGNIFTEPQEKEFVDFHGDDEPVSVDYVCPKCKHEGFEHCKTEKEALAKAQFYRKGD